MYDTKWSDEYLKSTGYKPNGSTEHDHLCRCPGCEGNDPPEDQQVIREAYQAGQVDPDGLDEFGSHLWNAVEAGAMMQGVCPCGVEGCRGLDWLLDGEEPF